MRFYICCAGLATLFLGGCGGGDSGAPAAQPTVTLTASPMTVSGTSPSSLMWNSANATTCTGSGSWSGNLDIAGTRATGALTSAATYSLICSGPGGASIEASVTVNVVPSVTLTAMPQTVAAGSGTTLTWSSANATACTASGGWSGNVGATGTQTTSPLTQTTTYNLICVGPGGDSEPANATINVSAAPAPNLVLTSNVHAVAPGGAAILSWSSSNAATCAASGGWSGSVPLSGTRSTGAIASTTTYSITCTGLGGSQTTSATVVSGQVVISPQTAALTASQTQPFMAVAPDGGGLSWTVDGVAGGNASVGGITSSGVYTPGSAAGMHLITAASVAYPALTGTASAAVTALRGVYTYHNDLARDGANTQEYALTTGTVTSASFGKRFSCVLDGAAYGQPLWVSGLTVAGASHNVVLIATEHDTVYAFDADAAPCVQLWSASLIDLNHGGLSGETPVPSGNLNFLVGRGAGDLSPEVGVTGTPVIDPDTNTLYVVAKSVAAQQTFYQRLHAIDLATGNEKIGSPTIITANYPGGGDGGTTVAFNPRLENQRAGLALVNKTIYIAWSSHEDVGPWYGWVLAYAYDGASFTQTAVFNAAPNAQQAGIWMAGGAPAVDAAGNLYLVTGNGKFDAALSDTPNTDYGDSLLQLSSTLGLTQYFTPSDQATDQGGDKDFGAGGAALLADVSAGSFVSHLLLCGGKDGSLYVLNQDSLGSFGDDLAVQKIDFGYPIFATGGFWNSNFYVSGSRGPLTQYTLGAAVAPMNLTAVSSHVYGFGGSTPSISAANLQGGIVWTLDNSQYCTGNAPTCGPTVLYAHDALNIATELWDSAIDAADSAGNAVKFTVPTIANGKVYVGTRGNNAGGASGSTTVDGELDVYGLK